MSIQKSVFWFAFGNLTYTGGQWLITVLVTRGSGLNDAGILSLAMSISATFQAIAFFGMRNYQVSDINGKYSDSLYIRSRFVTCFAALLSCGLFVLLNRYQIKQSAAILLFMCFRLSEAFSDVFHGILQKKNHLDLVGIGYFCKGVVIVVFFFAGYYLFRSLNTGLFAMTVGVIFVTLLCDLKNAGQFSSFSISLSLKANSAALLKETAPLCICVWFQLAISTAPRYILEKMCDQTALGAYSAVFAPALIIQTVATYIFTPLIGRFSQYYLNREADKFKRLFFQISLCIATMGLVAALCVKLVGWKLLNIIFGPTISGYEYLMIPIVFCTTVNAAFFFCCMLSVVIRDFRGQMIACLSGFVLCAGSTVVCISRFGINGTSYGLIIGILSAISVIVFRLRRMISGLNP